MSSLSVLQIRKLEEALAASNQELEKSKEVLKTNENGESVIGSFDCASLTDTRSVPFSNMCMIEILCKNASNPIHTSQFYAEFNE